MSYLIDDNRSAASAVAAAHVVLRLEGVRPKTKDAPTINPLLGSNCDSKSDRTEQSRRPPTASDTRSRHD
ncbi:hypothetical protein PRIPAC_94858 [Pristionchus pacificus]|uniref:Uncharacterized protein n=1 Tax=Pristionchus pacificus TaxID=54126 RepID=A0A2A6BAN9_PRIPA|nr:hypothetical protein PRIPAC_94858 [Pristionchus pacificus]|eukprot:PDM62934.1 hypothetical protein PRIPAC_50149 [Pristionchus pacificus]